MAADRVAQGLTQTVEQVPAVRHLHRVGCAAARAISIKARTVARDDLDLRPALQPARNTVGITIGKQVKYAIALQIADDRSISLATTPSPIVDADDGRGHEIRQGSRVNHPEQGVATDRHGQFARQARAGFSADRKAHCQ
ncbi:hypothetical protein ACM41_11715 [Bradyrhizobium sp. CCBAU 21362]|nr:hypothetical protein [Bradyrhizobium sp. CCBAU 21362]